MSVMINFCSRDREHALRCLRVAAAQPELMDTKDSAGPLLDLIDQDVVRVQDPDFHWPAKVITGKKWDSKRVDEVKAALKPVKGGFL